MLVMPIIAWLFLAQAGVATRVKSIFQPFLRHKSLDAGNAVRLICVRDVRDTDNLAASKEKFASASRKDAKNAKQTRPVLVNHERRTE
jgi:hypothetical protein